MFVDRQQAGFQNSHELVKQPRFCRMFSHKYHHSARMDTNADAGTDGADHAQSMLGCAANAANAANDARRVCVQCVQCVGGGGDDDDEEETIRATCATRF